MAIIHHMIFFHLIDGLEPAKQQQHMASCGPTYPASNKIALTVRLHCYEIYSTNVRQLRASLSQCAACRQLRGGVFASQLAPPSRRAALARPRGVMYYRSRRGKCDGGFTNGNMQAK